jgi:xanthine dehydrogenase YagT iron-sulfur-binding subunit
MSGRQESHPHRPPAGFSRRDFLTGTGTSAVSAVLLEGGLSAAAEGQQAAQPVVRGPGPVTIMLRVNGVQRELRVEPRTTLAEALRTDLDLTGTKIVCDRGACSACTVFLDDVPVPACMTLVLDVGDRSVTTIEGLARGEELHPVQQAFIDHDGLQCGFCTPGMVMSCVALLRRRPDPTPDEVREATSGNLCRCGTYPKVFEAALAAAKAMQAQGAGKGV